MPAPFPCFIFFHGTCPTVHTECALRLPTQTAGCKDIFVYLAQFVKPCTEYGTCWRNESNKQKCNPSVPQFLYL
jgi:hypothetical protein